MRPDALLPGQCIMVFGEPGSNHSSMNIVLRTTICPQNALYAASPGAVHRCCRDLIHLDNIYCPHPL